MSAPLRDVPVETIRHYASERLPHPVGDQRLHTQILNQGKEAQRKPLQEQIKAARRWPELPVHTPEIEFGSEDLLIQAPEQSQRSRFIVVGRDEIKALVRRSALQILPRPERTAPLQHRWIRRHGERTAVEHGHGRKQLLFKLAMAGGRHRP